MRRIGIDGVIGLVLLVLCAELYRESYYFRVPQFATMSPSTWPRFLLILLATLSIVLLAQALRQPQAEIPSDAPARPIKPVSHRNAMICFALFAAFVFALHWLGMLLAGIVFVFIMQELLGPRDFRSRLMHAAIAIVAVGGMWALFTFALRVILPEGMFLRL